eukprot:556441-Pyramimonas_sp.AAC.1
MKRRKFAPCWSLPTEIHLIMTNPCILSEPGAQAAGLGLLMSFDPMDFESPPDPSKRKPPLEEYTQASKLPSYSCYSEPGQHESD